ncbi:MAG TPA: flagellar export protein FliJ [Miltoncostaeaceae bacterium]|nr:flagellar export protein FliJ [Miltoncostaeaceae bacterium]
MSRPFRFRLDPVLELRRRREELVQAEFAQAVLAAAAQQERAVEAQSAVERATDEMRVQAAGPVALLELRGMSDELSRLRRVVAHEREMVGRMEALADERRRELVQASRDREALETLRRRAEDAHRAAEGRREQSELDELATRRAARPPRRPAGAAA